MSANIPGLLAEQGVSNNAFLNVNAGMGLKGASENALSGEKSAFSETFLHSLSLLAHAGGAHESTSATLALARNLPLDGKSLPHSLPTELLTALSEFTGLDIKTVEGLLLEAESDGVDLAQLFQVNGDLEETFKFDEFTIPPWLSQKISGLRNDVSGEDEIVRNQDPALLRQTGQRHAVQLPIMTAYLAQNAPVEAQAVEPVINAGVQTLATRAFRETSILSHKNIASSEVLGMFFNEQQPQPVTSTMVSQQPQQMTSEKMTGLEISAPVNQKLWAEELGQKVRWLTGNNIQAAEIRINPPHLGPIEVRISMEGEKMSVMFTAQHASVRDALDSAIPRLRDSLQDEGMELVNVDISQQSFSQRRETMDSFVNQDTSYNSDEGADELGEDSAAAIGAEEQIVRMGIVDYYV